MPRAQRGQATGGPAAASLLPRAVESCPVSDPVTWSLGSYPKETTEGKRTGDCGTICSRERSPVPAEANVGTARVLCRAAGDGHGAGRAIPGPDALGV